MRRQAERWGAELFQEDVESIDVRTSPFTIRSSEREVNTIYNACFVAIIFIVFFMTFRTQLRKSV